MGIAKREVQLSEIGARLSQAAPIVASASYHTPGQAVSRVLAVAHSLSRGGGGS